jgi:hypothetical protein
MDPDITAQCGFDRQDYDLGHQILDVDGEYDVFGAGSVTRLPTYRHTLGHHSLKLRLCTREIVLAVGACYFCCTLREWRLPKSCTIGGDARHSIRPTCGAVIGWAMPTISASV